MEEVSTRLPEIWTLLQAIPTEHPVLFHWWSTVLRCLFPLLAGVVICPILRSMLYSARKPELWAILSHSQGITESLTHWENIVGRSGGCDIRLSHPSVRPQHLALIRREDGSWTVYPLDSRGTTLVDGGAVPPWGRTMGPGEVLQVGEISLDLLPVSKEEEEHRLRTSKAPVAPWGSLTALTIFQMLAGLSLAMAGPEAQAAQTWRAFGLLSGMMWLYCVLVRGLGGRGLEVETVAFFLSTLSLGITASSAPKLVMKQLGAIGLGVLFFLGLCLLLRRLPLVKGLRWKMAAGAIFLLSLSILFGEVKYGAANWISLGGISFQPSELAKICYIFAGSATLDRLFRRRNLGGFMVLTGICMGCLAWMSDFGTAAIFFVTFFVISYLRSGDFATLALVASGAIFGALVIFSMKPYILRRFAVWGHAWEQVWDGGFQQTRTMSAIASGGLLGVGPGRGWLKQISAADTDLVFGMLCEEWGVIIGVLAVLCLAAMAMFAVRSCHAGRSSFYTIAACAATSLLVFQTSLNIFGSVDLLPLTGVTFPFVSNGGSSMLASWGLLAFLKGADTRSKASLAIQTAKAARRWPVLHCFQQTWGRRGGGMHHEKN